MPTQAISPRRVVRGLVAPFRTSRQKVCGYEKHKTEGACVDNAPDLKSGAIFGRSFMYSTGKLIGITDWELYNETGRRNLWEAACGSLTLEDLFTTDTVYASARHAASGFMNKKDTFVFMQDIWSNSLKLKEKVLSGKFRPEYYPQKVIMERGKQRIIKPPTFACKVVQKVICDYMIRPLFEPLMIDTSYASVKGRGTHQMYVDIETALNRKDLAGYSIVTGDYSNYFGNISIDYLMEEIFAPGIKDKRILDIIRMFSPDEYGLSLGNELSQIPASYLPSKFDHYVKDELGYPYFRFMDDCLAIVPKEKTDEYIQKYMEYADQIHSVTSMEKIRVAEYGKPFQFCKELFLWDKKKKRYYTLPNPKLEANERRKLKKMKENCKNGIIPEKHILSQYRSVVGGLANRPNTWKIRKRLEKEIEDIHIPE